MKTIGIDTAYVDIFQQILVGSFAWVPYGVIEITVTPVPGRHG